ncbi:MAG: autophagy-related protein 13-domain-containing protein, partial [Benjaminiella poitrasii]
FNIATEDVESLREDLKYWKNMAVQSTLDKEPPPMIIDIYLDTSKLSLNQTLVVADDNLRWGCVELKSQTADTHIDRILIESWELTLNILTRLLPGYDLYRKLHKTNDSSNLLSIGCRLSTSTVQRNHSEISIDSTILESDARKPTKTYEFSEVVTPIGTFKLQVTYRRNCNFRIENSERDLSAQFIDMDEQFFTPTMLKYKQEQQQLLQQKQRQQRSTFVVGSSGSNSIRNESPSTSTSTSRRASAAFVVSPFKSPFLSSSPQAESMFSAAAGVGGLTKIQADNKYRASPLMLHSNSSTSSTAIDHPGTMTVTSGIESSRKIEFSSSFEKYKSSSPTKTVDASTMTMRRWSRASDHTNSSVNLREYESSVDDDLEDFVRLVRSNQELRMFSSPKPPTALASTTITTITSTTTAGSTSSPKNQNVLSHFQNLRETHNSLSDSLSSSMMLAKPQQQQQQQHEGATISPVSSISSTSRSYQPIIPSPLHAEQRSSSPVHIPRSFPQLRSLSSTQNALRLARLDTDDNSHDDESGGNNNDLSAYSTYPQDYHRQELYLLRNNDYSPSSEYYRGRRTEDLVSEQEQPMDDDDSLVFKMSELECCEDTNNTEPQEQPVVSITAAASSLLTSAQQQQQTQSQSQNTGILYKHASFLRSNDNNNSTAHSYLRMPSSSPTLANNNRVNEHYLELTPTPLSPPLLHRLQNISTSTENVEKEEKSNDTATVIAATKNIKPTSSLPFDGW